jgi:hypothetical protein
LSNFISPDALVFATLRKAEATALASSGVQYADPIRILAPLKRIFTPYLLTFFPRVLVTLDGNLFVYLLPRGNFGAWEVNVAALAGIFAICMNLFYARKLNAASRRSVTIRNDLMSSVHPPIWNEKENTTTTGVVGKV